MVVDSFNNGRVFFVVEEEGDISADGIAYGYFHVQDGWYVQTKLTFTQGELSGVAYRANLQSSGTASKTEELSGDELSALLPEESIIKNDDGSYTIAKDVIDAIKTNMNKEWDILYLTINSEYADTNLVYYYNIDAIVPDEISLNEDMYGSREYIDWDVYFEEIGSSGSGIIGGTGYQVSINENGDVVISLNSDEMIDVNFDANMDKDIGANEALIYNEEKSKETGLEMYQAIDTHRYTDTFIYFAGKLYDNNYYYNHYATNYIELGLKDIFLTYYEVSDIYYRYDTFDEGERIYTTDLGFGTSDYQKSWIGVHVQIVDSKLCVLQGIEYETDIAIKYESIVPIEEYL